MTLTAEMQHELANLARAANRRIERATPGQRQALEYYLKGYHTRERENGMRVFQQGKAKSVSEYKQRMKELRKFMGTEEEPTISRRSEWEKVKREAVKKAGETIRKQGYNITDDELSNILQEAHPADSTEFYKALANVEISKNEAGDFWNATRNEIAKALESRRTAQERAEALIRSRKEASELQRQKSRKISKLVREARQKRGM